jgi:glutaredoxin
VSKAIPRPVSKANALSATVLDEKRKSSPSNCTCSTNAPGSTALAQAATSRREPKKQLPKDGTMDFHFIDDHGIKLNWEQSMKMIKFYTRPGCHLCAEALRVLESIKSEFDFEIQIIDISESSELNDLYGTQIPVAQLNGKTILKHRANEKVLRRILSR